MNYVDYARASGMMPPEFGKCARCGQRTEVEPVHLKKRSVMVCRKCKQELEGMDEESHDLQEFPY